MCANWKSICDGNAIWLPFGHQMTNMAPAGRGGVHRDWDVDNAQARARAGRKARAKARKTQQILPGAVCWLHPRPCSRYAYVYAHALSMLWREREREREQKTRKYVCVCGCMWVYVGVCVCVLETNDNRQVSLTSVLGNHLNSTLAFFSAYSRAWMGLTLTPILRSRATIMLRKQTLQDPWQRPSSATIPRLRWTTTGGRTKKPCCCGNRMPSLTRPPFDSGTACRNVRF